MRHMESRRVDFDGESWTPEASGSRREVREEDACNAFRGLINGALFGALLWLMLLALFL